MWPAGLAAVGVALSGRIAPTEQAEPGRTIGWFSGIGWGPRLRAVLEDEVDGPVPDDLVAAAAAVLAGWEWERRPAAVVAIPSRSRPLLVNTLAERIAALGRLAWLGPLASSKSLPIGAGGRSNSAQRVRGMIGAFSVPAAIRSQLPVLSGAPVLLVDDLIDTGWTAAIAARELRLAGAAAVLPFALALSR